MYLIAPPGKLIRRPLDAAPRQGLPLVFDRGHVGFLDKLVAGKDKSLPDGLQGCGLNRIPALVVEEFLVDPILIVLGRGSKGLRFGHHVIGSLRSLLEKIRPRCLDVGRKGGQLLLRKQSTVFHHRRCPQISDDPRGIPAGLGVR